MNPGMNSGETAGPEKPPPGGPENKTRGLVPGPLSFGFLAAVALPVAALDQLTKYLVMTSIPLYHEVQVIPGFFQLTHARNPGGAFGFLAGQGLGLRRLLFVFATMGAVIFLFWLFRRIPSTHKWLAAAVSLIIGGAMGNLADRIRFGEVVDFLDFFIKDLHWPAFNLADSAVSVGIGIFLVHLLFNRLPEDT